VRNIIILIETINDVYAPPSRRRGSSSKTPLMILGGRHRGGRNHLCRKRALMPTNAKDTKSGVMHKCVGNCPTRM
jgi:hypothetical protein